MNEWRDIDTAPRDRHIFVYAPGAEFDLPDIVSLCRWHPDAGFCVDELRYPTLWAEIDYPAPPATPSAHSVAKQEAEPR
ncbi:hypothetical protein [Methylopila sp. 73B]|uniref:hypothetical protein n=1 Tax=Methylopila sp. 73B TaxID=1120792 RepID=UPI00035E5083|nr:hypothetical protein [Methylopila sp. 73B]